MMHNFKKSTAVEFMLGYSGSRKNIKAIQLAPVKIRQIFPRHFSAKATNCVTPQRLASVFLYSNPNFCCERLSRATGCETFH